MTWAAIILQVLKFLNWAIEYGKEQKWISEGQQREIAAQLSRIKEKVEVVNVVADNISRLDDKQLDGVLSGLEPGSDGQLLSGVQESDNTKGRRLDTSIAGREGKTSSE